MPRLTSRHFLNSFHRHAQLAERHGVPSLIENKAQARAAEAKLNALSVSEEGVRECRTAVTRIKAQYREHLRERAIQSVKGWVQEWRRVE